MLSRPGEGREELAVQIAPSSTSDQSAASPIQQGSACLFFFVCGQKNQEYTKQCVKQLFKSSFLFLLIILKSKVLFKSSLLSHSLPCCLPPCCCSSAPHLPPAPSRPLSARSGNKARHRVSSRNSGSGGGCLPTDSETCCAYQRGEYFYQQANSSDRNFSLHSC